MKWAIAISSLSFVASSIAAPTDGLDLFKLKVSSPKQDINGRYLSSNASTIGIYDDGDEGSAIRVYKTTSQKAGCSQLHTYPVGIVDHALALVGSNGLMTLTDMVNPAGAKPEDAEWDAFRVSDGKLTNDGQGRWVAFPGREGSWSLKWTDGSAFMTADYMPAEIVMEAAGQGRYNSE